MSTRRRYRPWFKDTWCEGYDPIKWVYSENARIWIGEVLTEAERLKRLREGTVTPNGVP